VDWATDLKIGDSAGWRKVARLVVRLAARRVRRWVPFGLRIGLAPVVGRRVGRVTDLKIGQYIGWRRGWRRVAGKSGWSFE